MKCDKNNVSTNNNILHNTHVLQWKVFKSSYAFFKLKTQAVTNVYVVGFLIISQVI